MKQRLKDVGIAFLALISAALMLFSAYGLYSHFKGQSADTPLEEMHQPGENVDIDTAIRKELVRISYENEFGYKYNGGQGTPFTGERTATFTNTTGEDFSDFYLQIMLYIVDDPSLYSDGESIPYAPIEIHPVFRGALKAGESVTISFSTDRDDYNYAAWGYLYSFAGE